MEDFSRSLITLQENGNRVHDTHHFSLVVIIFTPPKKDVQHERSRQGHVYFTSTLVPFLNCTAQQKKLYFHTEKPQKAANLGLFFLLLQSANLELVVKRTGESALHLQLVLCDYCDQDEHVIKSSCMPWRSLIPTLLRSPDPLYSGGN